jgi:hypothetical protein
LARNQTDKSFLVLFFKKEQALLFEKRSKNFLSVFPGWTAGDPPGGSSVRAACVAFADRRKTGLQVAHRCRGERDSGMPGTRDAT